MGFGSIITQWVNLGPRASAFQGEVFAVHKAAEWLQEEEDTSSLHFFIDSQAAFLALAQITCTSHIVSHCKAIIVELLQHRPVTLHWVKAHVGHETNEEADRAAKFGTISQWHYSVPLSGSWIKGELHKTGI